MTSQERPILMSGPMVRAILDGRKTMTRRVVTVPWCKGARTTPYEPYFVEEDGRLFAMDEHGDYRPFEEWRPPYSVGDRLYVRETWRQYEYSFKHDQVGIEYRADGKILGHVNVTRDFGWHPEGKSDGRWRSSRFMPKWASRLWLTVTEVRVERLQEISEEDAIAEGMEFHDGRPSGHHGWRHDRSYGCVDLTARGAFAVAWGLINAKRGYSWGSNPWVRTVSFEVPSLPESGQ